MANKLFVIGIGGTGMRCIESLIHLCAIGMFDNTEIHLLALDTDANNGNFSRLKALKESYVKAKGLDITNQVALKDTFFSAAIKYYEFCPDYQKNSSFKLVFNYDKIQYSNREMTDLADLVLTEDVEEFNLRHGYRAQTHLGSMMMYHSIIEAAKSQKKNDLQDFLHQLTVASQNGSPRVFILGSVFGGTGASSIPIIPKALSKGAEILNGGAVNVLKSAYFGSTLLTGYFNFKEPSENEIKKQRIIATSSRFALNSQVAMMFYDDDTTVKSTYQKFYMLGTEGTSWNPMQKNNDANAATITGGQSQENDSHYIELMAACAVLDFYNESESELKMNKDNMTTDYLYRSINENGKFDFSDFVGINRAQEFAKKFGLLIAFALFNNGSDNILEGLRSGLLKIEGFNNLDITQIEYVTKYFNLFYASKDDSGNLKEGWLKQIHRSAGMGDNLLFNASLFAPNNFKELMNLDWNKKIYRNEGIGKDHSYSKFMNSKFNDLKKEFIRTISSESKAVEISNPTERVYKLIYDTLSKLYKFNN